MQYINLYSLLAIEPGSSLDAPKAIRTAKKRVLAEIELEGEVWVDGININKSTALKVFDDLENENKCRFHASIFFDDAFLLFLTNGWTVWLYQDEQRDYIYENGFIEFISEFYSYQFDKTLDYALKNRDSDLVGALVNSEPLLLGPHQESAYASARIYFAEQLRNVKDRLKDLELSNDIKILLPPGNELLKPNSPFFNPFSHIERLSSPSDFENSLLHKNDLQIFNQLPQEFQLLRDDFSSALRNISIEIGNKYGEFEVAFLILQLAEKFEVGSRVGDLINSDIAIIQKILTRNNLDELNSQLESIKRQTKARVFSSATEISSTVVDIFDTSDLNSISTTENNSAIIGAALHIIEISWLVNTSYQNPDVSIQLIERCLQLKLSDSSVSSTLLNKLISVRSEIDQSRDLIVQARASQKKRASPTKQSEHKKHSENRNNQANTQKTNPRKESSSKETYSSATNVFDSYKENNNSSKRILSSLFTNLRNAGLAFNVTILVLTTLSIFIIGSIISTVFSPAKISQTANLSANQNGYQDNINQKTNVSSSPLPPIIRPASGTVLTQESIKLKGRGKLFITNDLDKDAVAKLVDSVSGKTYREVYVQERGKISLSGIRPGDYSLLFVTGIDYAPSVGRFLRNSSYSKFDRTFNYAESRNQYGIGYREYQVTLNPVAYGTASTSTIGENDFNDK